MSGPDQSVQCAEMHGIPCIPVSHWRRDGHVADYVILYLAFGIRSTILDSGIMLVYRLSRRARTRWACGGNTGPARSHASGQVYRGPWIRHARRALDLIPREAPPAVSPPGGASDRGGAYLARLIQLDLR